MKIMGRVDKVVHYLKKDIDLTLRCPKLEKKSLTLQAYSDASFASNYDHSLQIGSYFSGTRTIFVNPYIGPHTSLRDLIAQCEEAK